MRDAEKTKIPTALSCLFGFDLFQDDEDAVSIALEDIVVGEEYEGVINNVVTYGAFVDIGTEVRACSWMLRAGERYV